MRIVQCLIRCERTSVLLWLREEERLKVGAVVRLDEDARIWTVETVSFPHEFGVVADIEEPIL